MDHHYVEEYDIADRYLMGKLPTEEQAHFEEHFVDCPECLDRLETTERFRSGMQTVAAEEAARSNAYAQVGVLAWLMRLRDKRQALLLLAAIMLLVALPAVLLITEMKRARGEAEQAKIASSEWRRQYEEKQEVARKLEAKLQESNQKLIEQRQAAETELEQARRARELAITGAGSLKQFPATASIFTLVSVRGGESVNTIPLSRQAQMIFFKLEPFPGFQSYRATLTAADQRVIWRGSGLKLDDKESLGLSFSSRLFKVGDYQLTVEGLNSQGRYEIADKYPFHVIEK